MQDFQYLVVSPWQGIRKYKPFVRRTISTLTTESILPSWVFEAVKYRNGQLVFSGPDANAP